MKPISEMTVAELKDMAKSLGLSNYQKLKKEELQEMILNHMNPKTIVTKGDAFTSKEENQSVEKGNKMSKKTSNKAKKDSETKTGKKSSRKAGSADQELPAGVNNIAELDSGVVANGILEVMNEGFGFIRGKDYMPCDGDVYVGKNLIKAYSLRSGDMLTGPIRKKSDAIKEKFAALLEVHTVNGVEAVEGKERPLFENLTPIFPDEKIKLDTPGGKPSMRIIDLISPIGKGQRGMIVSPPKAGKTTLIKDIARSIKDNHPEIKLIILLIDERPEEVTDIREAINDPSVEVMSSTFDEHAEHHKKVSEMVIRRAKRLAESGKDVVILLDSITRLSRAYNLTITPSGRTLSGGLDPNALYGPKKFFGAARNLRGSGSLTIIATALVDTGSRMDDVIFEEFKGTGNMELVLDRRLSEKRVFPAIDVMKSGTRRDDLLLTSEERDIMNNVRKVISQVKPEDQSEIIIKKFKETKTESDFLNYFSKVKDLSGILN